MGEQEMQEEVFKTTLMGGYDKEDVLEQVGKIKSDAWEEQIRLKQEIAALQEKIAQLTKRLELKDEQYARLETDVKEKYQKYVDNYDSIGRLLFNAQVQADGIIEKAKEEAQQILKEAHAEARKCVEQMQTEVDERLAEGKKRYIAVQEEMNEVVELMNQAQNRFMASYKEVHKIISSMPESLQEIEDEPEEILVDQELVDHIEHLLQTEEE